MTAQSLTFKQYLNSREQLLKAVDNIPKTITEHIVHKYCTIAVGEDKDNSNIIQLKPKNTILIEWELEGNNLVPISIQVQEQMTLDDKMDIFWNTTKIQKWLTRHTTEKKYNGYKV